MLSGFASLICALICVQFVCKRYKKKSSLEGKELMSTFLASADKFCIGLDQNPNRLTF